MSQDRSAVVTSVCDALSLEQVDTARGVVRSEWPFEPFRPRRQNLSTAETAALWKRDGFIDRYTGSRLIFPGVLRLLSIWIPDEIPYQRNGRSDACHFMHWELFPSHDHVVPLARGGRHEMDNLVTTSMLRNQIKANWLVEELGWNILPPDTTSTWDGYLHWYMQQRTRFKQQISENAGLRRIDRIAMRLAA